MKRKILAVFKQVMHGGYVGGVPAQILVREFAKNLKVNFRCDRIDCQSRTRLNNTSNTKAFGNLPTVYLALAR